jgi:hypothetical protein
MPHKEYHLGKFGNIVLLTFPTRLVTPGFIKNKTRLIICVPRKSTHMSELKKVSETMLLYNVYIAILTPTSEYHGTVTKLQAPFFSGTADWG